MDLSETNGGRSFLWARKFPIFTFFLKRLNVKLIKTSELDSTKTYIFGIHPHGILPFGSLSGLVCENDYGFSSLFPGIQFRFLAASFCFYCPIYRDVLLGCGVIDAAKFSAKCAIEKGFSLALVPGGATEALYSRPDQDILYLRNRKGFIRLAIETGSHLVPVFAFVPHYLIERMNVMPLISLILILLSP